MKTEKEMAEKVSIITSAYKSNENTKYTKNKAGWKLQNLAM